MPKGAFRVYSTPISKIALEKVGKTVVTNIVAIGILAGITQLATEESIRKAILARVPKGTEEINMKAFDEGLKAGKGLL